MDTGMGSPHTEIQYKELTNQKMLTLNNMSSKHYPLVDIDQNHED